MRLMATHWGPSSRLASREASNAETHPKIGSRCQQCLETSATDVPRTVAGAGDASGRANGCRCRSGQARPVSDLITPRTHPWRALGAMLVGFFMTLIDWTAVSVANPSIMAALHADYESVIWVTSAYLLGFAVPLLVAGRLGDRFGPRNLY